MIYTRARWHARAPPVNNDRGHGDGAKLASLGARSSIPDGKRERSFGRELASFVRRAMSSATWVRMVLCGSRVRQPAPGFPWDLDRA
jgi:hypothetical protein